MRAPGRVMLFVAVVLAAAGGCAQRGDPPDAAVATTEADAEEPPEGEEDPPSETPRGDVFLNGEENECISERAEDEGIDETTVFTDATAVEDRIAYADIVMECVTRLDVLAELILGEVFRSYLPSAEVSMDEKECIVEYLLEEAEHPGRAAVQPTEADLEVFFAALQECLTAENYDIAVGAPGTGPQAYGDDERLDSMQDDCEGGEARACDLLFMRSAPGSDYETVALTCGGSRESDRREFCSDEAEVDSTGRAPADSPGLRVLAEDCKDGDATACDLLFLLAPLGHELENVGFTCGGRIATGAVPDCRTRLG